VKIARLDESHYPTQRPTFIAASSVAIFDPQVFDALASKGAMIGVTSTVCATTIATGVKQQTP